MLPTLWSLNQRQKNPNAPQILPVMIEFISVKFISVGEKDPFICLPCALSRGLRLGVAARKWSRQTEAG